MALGVSSLRRWKIGRDEGILEENLSRISALSDVLWVASLNPEYLKPAVIIKVSAIIQELAEKSIEALGDLMPADVKKLVL